MIIHSVTPIQYLLPPSPLPVMECKNIQGGLLEGYETPQGFSISRVISTDPKVYLDSKYAPGQIYRPGSDSRQP